MSRTALLALMCDRLGLDPSSLGERVLADACLDARRTLGAADDEALYTRVLGDAEAFAECAECFVVPESWFFRAPDQFTDLVRFARAHPGRRPLRVLSLPSASGEEAYSAAIALLQAGLAPSEVDVLGVDVSRAAVRRAQTGEFRLSALRGQALPPLMQETASGVAVDAVVRRCVRFRIGNALDAQLLRDEEPFDVVFCRNLLIYLTPPARERLIGNLLAAMATPALLLAGQAEVLSTLSDELQPYPGGTPLSFLYGAPKRPLRLPLPPAPELAEFVVRPAASAVAAPMRTSTLPDTTVALDVPDPVAEARRLADAGHTAEARAVCLARLKQDPADVAALFLLGLLASADGDAEASDRAFTQVLYLDRDHLDALEQRIGLAERRGETAQARQLRARALRLRQAREDRR